MSKFKFERFDNHPALYDTDVAESMETGMLSAILEDIETENDADLVSVITYPNVAGSIAAYAVLKRRPRD